MRPPTRIRDDHGASHARALLDAARPVRAMTPAERAASAARIAKISAAPAVGATALWLKGAFGVTVIGLALSVAAISTARPPAPDPPPRGSATVAVTAAKRAPPSRVADTQQAPRARTGAPAPPPAPVRLRARAPVTAVARAPETPPAAPQLPAPPPQRVALAATTEASAHARGADAAAGTGGGLAGVGLVDTNSLAEESRLLLEAMRARAHDPRAAVQWLLEHRRRFPRGGLSAERDVELFRTLDAMGDRVGARAEGEHFWREHRRHPSAAAIHRRVEEL